MMTGLLAFGFPKLEAADWFAIADLRGTWSFTVGDDPRWADPGIQTSDWDWLEVPGRWESRYPGYNGYAWYRRTFDLRLIPEKADVILFLGYIDDVDEVFINGHRIGQTGKFSPGLQTAYNVERRYRVPVSVLKSAGNVIAVRVYDSAVDGGIVRAENFGLYYDREQDWLAVNLSGTWKFSIENDGNMHDVNLRDDDWKEIFVPLAWENQGYPGYDGVAYYRKRFNLPQSLKGQELYLVLGKIDDFDKVYFNGTMIGRVEELDQYSRFRRDQSYSLTRIYKLPPGLLRSKNLVSVEVLDHWGAGGIYEGPVGIMTRDAALKMRDKHRKSGFNDWKFSIWELLHLFD